MEVHSYLSKKTRVGYSSIHGLGLFALKPIRQGEAVGIKGGHIIDWKTLAKNQSLIGDSYLQISDEFVLAPLERREVKKVMMFLNHSCNPNVGVCGEITFVAMSNIKKGEELTIDYAMIDDDVYRMRCRCGIKRCRGVVTGKDWKLPSVQRKYKNFFSAYIQNKITHG